MSLFAVSPISGDKHSQKGQNALALLLIWQLAENPYFHYHIFLWLPFVILPHCCQAFSILDADYEIRRLIAKSRIMCFAFLFV
ncbi:unnamed protein product [Meloidogyne enterolobii]|uniref:Uncharacterized protein n=1 Tax=Meloidogyne enterolobii TaxID=390850 RepID=A0ACB0Y2L0_MELEN